ncbi:MAG: hypothetical protein HYZ71_07510 [Deltaproteobacteria bacterium]|nr:hypothetical protein [Deltaproteobacteria bacterium]
MLSIRSLLNGTLLVCLVMSAVALAGGEAGNGGDALVCRNAVGEIKTVEFFDVYEARKVRQMVPKLGDPKLSPVAKVELMLKSIEGMSPTRTALYRQWLTTFFTDAKFLKAEILDNIPDAGPISYPKECAIEQLIVYREPLFPEDGPEKYLINQDLWDYLDNDNMAVAISHELIYREFTTIVQHPNSVRARYFNSNLFSMKLAVANYPEYTRIHIDAHTGYVDIHGVLAQINLLDKKYSPYAVDAEKNLREVPLQLYKSGTVYMAYVLNWDYAANMGQKLLPGYPFFGQTEQAKVIREGFFLPEYSYAKSGTQKMAIFGGGAQVDNIGTVAFHSNGALYTYRVPNFQADYVDERGPSDSHFLVKINDSSAIDLINTCALFYGPVEVAIHPNGLLRSYEAGTCSMRPEQPLEVSFTTKKGDIYDMEVSSNNTYPGSQLRLEFFDGAPNLAYIPTGTHNPVRVSKRGVLLFEGYKMRYYYGHDEMFTTESKIPGAFCGPDHGFTVSTPVLEGHSFFFIKATEGSMPERELECSTTDLRFETNPADGHLFSCGYKGDYHKEKPILILTGSGEKIRRADFYPTGKRRSIECTTK